MRRNPNCPDKKNPCPYLLPHDHPRVPLPVRETRAITTDLTLAQLLQVVPRTIKGGRGTWSEDEHFFVLTTHAKKYASNDGFTHYAWRAGYDTLGIDGSRKLWDSTGNVEIAGYAKTPERAVRELITKLRRYKFLA